MNTTALDQLLTSGQGHLYHQALCACHQKDRPHYFYAVACTKEAVFDLASISKIITTTFIIQLIGQKHLSLSTSLLQGLGDEGAFLSKETRERLDIITIEKALLHHSGLPAWYPFYTGDAFYPTLDRLLQQAPVLPHTLYSDLNFILLGKIVQNSSGKSLPLLLEELNSLLGTGFCYNPKNPQACIATEDGNQIEMAMCKDRGLDLLPTKTRKGWRSTQVQIQGQVNDGNAFYVFNGVSGHAGVFGTGDDLLALGQMYINSFKGRGPLNQSLARRALTDQGTGRGLGFDATPAIFPHGAGHNGFTGTALYICPEKALCAVLLASRLALPGPPNMQKLRSEVFHFFYSGS